MAANAATLQADARCIQQCVEPGFEVPILIYLFSQIAGVSPDPKTLMANARCLEACIPPGMMLSVLVSLASQILSGGSAGPGTRQVFSGNGSPVGVLTPITDEAIYFQKDSDPTGLIWEWYDNSWTH